MNATKAFAVGRYGPKINPTGAHVLWNGPPIEADGYKVSTEWIFTDDDGQVVTLYDYKETSLYDHGLPSVKKFRAWPSYDWHVGARNRAVADRFVQWLQKRLAIA